MPATWRLLRPSARVCRPLVDESVDGAAVVSKAEVQRRLRQRVVAVSAFPSVNGTLVLDEVSGLRHLHVLGPSGVGKSTLLANLILQDIAAQRGVVVVDPRAILSTTCCAACPAMRWSELRCWIRPTERRWVSTRWRVGLVARDQGWRWKDCSGCCIRCGLSRGDHGWEMCCTLGC